MTTTSERRRRVRSPQSASPMGQNVRLRFRTRQGLERLVTVRLTNVSEYGCGLESDCDLPLVAGVTLEGDLSRHGGPRTARLQGRVTWCELGPAASATYPKWRAGIEFITPVTLHREHQSHSFHTGAHTSAGENAAKPLAAAIEADHYETLQLSPNADPDTIHRIFRALAARFHPDNAETGSAEAFRKVHEAYKVLIDPVQRAAYDAAYAEQRRQRWKVFHQPSEAQGLAAEQAKRRAMLGLLYAKRAATPENAALSLAELEDVLGIPREHLEFPAWYLREAGHIVRTDNGRHSITIKGVMEHEQTPVTVPAAETRADHLLARAG